MSLLLCRQEPVENPFYIEELGLYLYSSQELSYVIGNHPLLVMEGFVDDRLILFLRSELRMPFLAERLEKWIKGRGPSDELLFQILADCAYYSPQEQTKFRQQVTAFRKLAAHEYEKKRADYFYSLGLYGKAASMYERILETTREKGLSGDFKGKIWNNIAACYTKLFCFQKAMHAYDCAWNEDEKTEYVKRMYFLTRMQPGIAVKERYLEQMPDAAKAEWEPEWQAAGKDIQEKKEPDRESAESAVKTEAAVETANAGTMPKAEGDKKDGNAVSTGKEETGEIDAMEKIREIFAKDPIKRLAQAGSVVNQWKVEYRRMI
ncbi:MAG: hypothetical protein HFE84_03975 [Lachnospiraceae bacterium]|jgi:tetratricopeptide (TPR) repeat protein|nr:hypothetical protein [Lachnospiraceae bacterium]